MPAQADGEGRAPDRFSDRAPQGNRFPQSDGFGGAEAMPEGQLTVFPHLAFAFGTLVIGQPAMQPGMDHNCNI